MRLIIPPQGSAALPSAPDRGIDSTHATRFEAALELMQSWHYPGKLIGLVPGLQPPVLWGLK